MKKAGEECMALLRTEQDVRESKDQDADSQEILHEGGWSAVRQLASHRAWGPGDAHCTLS